MKNVDAAWLAAAIDGEGTLSLFKRGNRYCATIRVFNNNLDFLKKVKMIIGDEHGGICARKNESGNITYNYGTQNSEIILNVISSIYPYLIVKKKNADILIDFLNGKSVETEKLVQSRPDTSIGAMNWLKGNHGNSEAHRKSALCASKEANSRRGNRGNHEQHRFAGCCKGKIKI